MNKIAFIIPGFGCPTGNKEYQEIAKYFKIAKFKPVLVEIDWKRKTHEDYVRQFKQQYLKHVNKDDKVCVLGFSFGAMTSFISPELKPAIQVLCSLSPYFKEDIPYVKESWKKFCGKKRCEVFQKLNFKNISKLNLCKTYILAGDKEPKLVHLRARDAQKKIKNSELFFLEGVKHDISDERYLKKIKEIISSL